MTRALGLAAFAASLAVVAAMTVPAWPHDWYPTSCCYGGKAGGDCAPIPASAVRETPDGYEVTLKAGDHPMVTGPLSFTFPYSKARDALDGRYHVCFRRTLEPRCFFAGPRGF